MFCDDIENLVHCFRHLQAQNVRLMEAVHADAPLPLLLYGTAGESDDRTMAARALTQIWQDDSTEAGLPQSGVICASPQTIQVVTHVNQAKLAFQRAVKQVRDHCQETKSRLDKMIDRALHRDGLRTESMILALRRAELGRINLKRTYAQIRILPEHLISVRWTWATKHSLIVPYTREEGISAAMALTNPKARDAAIALLSGLAEGERLAFKKPLPNQLRANLVYTEGEAVIRKQVTVSGVMVTPAPTLPTMKWRDDADITSTERAGRCDTQIEVNPYIKALHLYRYS